MKKTVREVRTRARVVVVSKKNAHHTGSGGDPRRSEIPPSASGVPPSPLLASAEPSLTLDARSAARLLSVKDSSS